jgi:hypothetical protein
MSFSSPLLAARAGKSMNVWSDERQAAYVPRTKTAARMPPCRRGRQGRRRQSTEASAAAGGELSTSMALSLSLSLSFSIVSLQAEQQLTSSYLVGPAELDGQAASLQAKQRSGQVSKLALAGVVYIYI